MYMKAKVRIDLNNQMWVDIYEATLFDIQRACLLGGTLMVYPVYKDEYRLGFTYSQDRVNVQFVGIEITKEQYQTQKSMWGGDHQKRVAPNTELLLLDNQYFL
jgi:hypothetical protein